MSSRTVYRTLLQLVLVLALSGLSAAPAGVFVTPLRARGCAVVPQPQKVELGQADVALSPSWRLEAAAGVDKFTVEWLSRWSWDLAGLRFSPGAAAGGKIVLRIKPGTVAAGIEPELAAQGYLLTAGKDSITITGNSQQGLFYGVCTFVQMLRRDRDGWSVPASRIEDWPDLQLRFLHKDIKFHQERPETVERHLDWMALMKVNCVAFDLDDRFEFPSHPRVGMPGAYTTEEMRHFTRYGLERHIQLVPDMQSPSHFNWALKHPEFAHLRSDGNNYQACLCDPEAVQFIRDLFGDLIEATPGVEYIHMSMDEVYYAGICEKCTRPFNDENRSLAWVDYLNSQYEWLTKRGRKALAWVEYPLLPEHISLLPSGLISAILANRTFIEAENKAGIRQLVYTALQGQEFLFPNYFPYTDNENRLVEGRLIQAWRTMIHGKEMAPRAIGSFAAFWDCSEPHEEAAWLGWATVNQYAWNQKGPSLDQHIEDFFDLFYGGFRPDMTALFKMLVEQTRYYEYGWDIVPSTTRGPAYGNHVGKGIGTERFDYVLPPPGLPRPEDLALESSFSDSHAALVEKAQPMLTKNAILSAELTRWAGRVERNRYSLEVFLAAARFSEYFIRTVMTMAEAEKLVKSAARSHASGNHQAAADKLETARHLVETHLLWANDLWRDFKETWERSRFPKGRSVNGRDYVFIPNDSKDLWADRTPDMEFMVVPFQRIGLDRWVDQMAGLTKTYAAKYGVEPKALPPERFDN